MWMKAAAKYAGGALLAGALLWWVMRGTDPRAVWEQLRQASLIGLALSVFLNVGHSVFRVLRWRALLEPIRPGIPFRPMFVAVILGYMTSWIIPGRLGELVRPALLAGRCRLPLGPCLGSVLADRLLDGMAVLVLFGVGLWVTPISGESVVHAGWIRGAALLLVGLISVPFFILVLASGARERIEALCAGRTGWRAWLGRTVLALSQGVEALKRPRLIVRVTLYTAVCWLMIAGATWVGVRACGAAVSFGAILIMMPLLVLGIAIPTPGGAGGYHAAMKFGLTRLFLVSEPVAVGAGFLMHAVVVIPVVLLGSALLLVDRIPVQDLFRAARQVRDLGSSPAASGEVGRPAERLS